MNSLLKNVRFYVLISNIFLSIFIFLLTTQLFQGSTQIIKLTQAYALLALFFLYVTLLSGPLCFTFRNLPFRGIYLKARRALGVSAFYFGLLHACFAFFGQLGGFQGLFFLSNRYLLAISLSFIAFLILLLMALTSFDVMVSKLTFPKWKFLHRFVYVASILILIHALMLGTHFENFSSLITQISFVAISFLLILEAIRLDSFLHKRFSFLPKLGITIFAVIVSLSTILIFSNLSSSQIPSLSIHSQHIQIAKDANLQNQTNQQNSPQSLQGDKTKRYTVTIDTPDTISPNQDTTIHFKVYDASNGSQTVLFKAVYEKPMHLIIVDNPLSYFSHIHPVQKEDEFVVTTQFPQSGLYRLYLDFQPFGAMEQQVAFSIHVGVHDQNSPEIASQPIDANFTKKFGSYEVTLSSSGVLKASSMSLGQQKIFFTLKDAKTQQPITTLQPYLGAFGHLVMINQRTYDYAHVHPASTNVPETKIGGPSVEFIPMGIYGPFKTGAYRVFAQFNPNNELFTADFTVEVK